MPILTTPDGRDRALDEVVPVLKAMADSITRDELMREVGERLGADPGLVARRLAAAPRLPVLPTPVRRRSQSRQRSRRLRPPRERLLRAGRLNVQERRERGLLRDVHRGACVSGASIVEKLKHEHLSTPAMGRVRDWLAEHLDDPVKGLPRRRR